MKKIKASGFFSVLRAIFNSQKKIPYADTTKTKTGCEATPSSYEAKPNENRPDKQELLKKLFNYDEVVYHMHISSIVKQVTEQKFDEAIFTIQSLKKSLASCKSDNIGIG